MICFFASRVVWFRHGEIIEALGRGGKKPGQKWEPKDNGDVDWILRHTARAESEVALIDARIKRLNAAKKTAKATATFFREQWKLPLLALAKAVLSTVSGKGSTVKYDYGDLQVRSYKDRRIKITDKAKLAGLLEAHGFGIAVTRTFPTTEHIEIDKDAVPGHIWDAMATGTLLAGTEKYDLRVLGREELGCEVKPPGDELVIKTPKAATVNGDD